jgi:hypothetical protein
VVAAGSRGSRRSPGTPTTWAVERPAKWTAPRVRTTEAGRRRGARPAATTRVWRSCLRPPAPRPAAARPPVMEDRGDRAREAPIAQEGVRPEPRQDRLRPDRPGLGTGRPRTRGRSGDSRPRGPHRALRTGLRPVRPQVRRCPPRRLLVPGGRGECRRGLRPSDPAPRRCRPDDPNRRERGPPEAALPPAPRPT